MHTTQFLSLVLSLNFFSVFAAKPVPPITINPTVKTFDSIPKVQTERTFFVGTVQDTSLQRDETGKVGETRIRRRKMAPLLSDPPPAIVIKRSLEGLLINQELKASVPDSADYTIRLFILEFGLTESKRKLGQTMEANITIQVSLVSREDSTQIKQYTIKSQNSKSTIDTSKYAESILRGAVEDALKEIIKSITR